MNILKQLQNLDITDLKYIYKKLYNRNIKGNKKQHIISIILSPLNISYKFTVNNVKKLQELRKKRNKLKKEKDKLFKIYRNKKTSVCAPHPEEIEERQKIDKEIKLTEIKINKLYQKIFKDFKFK